MSVDGSAFSSKRSWFTGWTFPIGLLAFVAVGVSYLDRVFSTTTRWVFLVLLLVSLIPRGEIFEVRKSRFAPFLLAYLLWCFTTGLWSSVPPLSAAKVAAFTLVATAFLGGGYLWVKRHPERPLFFLLPVVVTALFAGLIGQGKSVQLVSGITIYQGLSGNPNYLGILAAGALPLPLYQSYSLRQQGAKRSQVWFWGAITSALLVVLWWSGSRASILCALATSVPFFLVVTSGRRTGIAILLVGLVLAVAVIEPDIEQGVYQRVVIKSTVETDTFLSRRDTWEKTYDAAQRGRFLGFGYGVSAGADDYSLDVTSIGYGREKGNAQLAVWEETGLVGLGFYVIVLFALFQELLGTLFRVQDAGQRAEFALLVGLTTGLLAQSMFEAWWTSPGSMESALFWSAVGVATALAERFRLGQQSHAAATNSEPLAVRGA